MKSISLSLLETNKSYPFKIFLQLSENKVITLFNENTCLNQEDLDKIKYYHDLKHKILLEDDAFEQFLLSNLSSCENRIKPQIAETLTYDIFNKTRGVSNKDFLDTVVAETNKIIRSILSNNKNKASRIILNLLEEVKKSDNIYMTHTNRLFSLSSLVLFLTPNKGNVDFIHDLGQASLLHGFSLNYLNDPKDTSFLKSLPIDLDKIILREENETELKRIAELHYYGHKIKSFNDVTTYLKSFDVMDQIIKEKRKFFTQGIGRTIQDFKKLMIPKGMGIPLTKKPYISSQIMLMADHALSKLELLIQEHPDQATDNILVDVLREIKEETVNNKSLVHHDIDLIYTLIEKIGVDI